MPVRMLQLADCEIGAAHAHLGDRAASRRDDVLATFRSAIDYALDRAHGIDVVLVAGNLFDTHRPEPDHVALVRGCFARLAANGTSVVVLPGHRDSIATRDSVWRTERFAGVDVITQSTAGGEPLVKDVRGTKVAFHGITFVPGRTAVPFTGFGAAAPAPANAMDDAAAAGDDTTLHVGVLHGLVAGHAEEATRPSAWSFAPAELGASGMSYIALGGAHGASRYDFGPVVAAYSGTIEGNAFAPGDTGARSLLVVDLAPGTVRLTTQPTGRRELVNDTIDLSTEGIRDVSALRAALLARAGEHVHARFTLTGTREFLADHEALLTSLEGAIGSCELIDRTSFENSLLVRRIGTESTIRGYFVRKMLKELDALRARLARRPDDAAVARSIRVAERALDLGLAPFLDVDAAGSASASNGTAAHARAAVIAPTRARASIGGAAPAAPATARAPAAATPATIARPVADTEQPPTLEAGF